MRMAIAVLADAASVREGLVSLLSAGVTQLNRSEFPAPMGANLVLVGEMSATEAEKVRELIIRTKIEAPDGSLIVDFEGRLEAVPASSLVPGQSVQVPVVLDFTNLQIPMPGTYVVTTQFATLDEFAFEFYAALVPATGTSRDQQPLPGSDSSGI